MKVFARLVNESAILLTVEDDEGRQLQTTLPIADLRGVAVLSDGRAFWDAGMEAGRVTIAPGAERADLP